MEDSTTEHTDHLVPVDSDKEPIVWDGNDAHIAGILYEVGLYYETQGLFQSLFEHRAVTLSNGKLAVESLSSIPFILGDISDGSSFDSPCPADAVQRLVDANATTLASGGTIVAAPGTIDRDMPFIIAKYHVKAEVSRLLTSLKHVIAGAPNAGNLLEAARGDGFKLLKALRDREKLADGRDRALATTRHQSIILKGVQSELTLASLDAFLKTYRRAKRHLPPSSRQSDAEELEMINSIAYRAGRRRASSTMSANVAYSHSGTPGG